MLLGSSCTGVTVSSEDLVEFGSAMLCGTRGGGRTVDESEVDVTAETTESKEGMCRRCGARRHLTSGALTRTGVRRWRIGDKTRKISGDLARSSFVMMSTAGVRLSRGADDVGVFVVLDSASVAPTVTLKLCAESLRTSGGIANDMFAAVLSVRMSKGRSGVDE